MSVHVYVRIMMHQGGKLEGLDLFFSSGNLKFKHGINIAPHPLKFALGQFLRYYSSDGC